ncbi:2-C-methyl-D-erythritol 2,4-cyclodiphosphate synthase [Chloroflexota bacterium]
MRVGFGYDVHLLVQERDLILGGVNIPFDKGLLGHSDADVLTHAIADALLGAAGLKDIGTHFPPNDPAYKNIASLVLLEKVNRLLKSNGYIINNIDATVVAEQPTLAPFIDNICKAISDTLEISSSQVNIKATTQEGLGFIGKGMGIAAHAIAAIE